MYVHVYTIVRAHALNYLWTYIYTLAAKPHTEAATVGNFSLAPKSRWCDLSLLCFLFFGALVEQKLNTSFSH